MNLFGKIPLIIVFCTLLTSSCTQSTDNTILIGLLHGPSEVSFLHMMANPPKIDGKKVEFVVKDDPQQIQALILKNELEMAVLPTNMAAQLYNKKVNYSMVACPIWGTLYLVTNQPKIKKVTDISNQSVSIFGQGATPDILFRRFIEKNSLKNIKFDYSYSGNSELMIALLSGKATMGILSEPAVTLVLRKNPNIRILSKIDCENFINNTNKDIFTQSAFVVNNEFAKEYPETMHMLCEAYSESCNKVNEDPQKTAALIQKIMPFDTTEMALNSISRCNIRYVAAFAIEKEINNYLQIFLDFNPKTLSGKLPDRNFIYQPQ